MSRGKINVRLQQINHNHNHNLIGFDTIWINIVLEKCWDHYPKQFPRLIFGPLKKESLLKHSEGEWKGKNKLVFFSWLKYLLCSNSMSNFTLWSSVQSCKKSLWFRKPNDVHYHFVRMFLMWEVANDKLELSRAKLRDKLLQPLLIYTLKPTVSSPTTGSKRIQEFHWFQNFKILNRSEFYLQLFRHIFPHLHHQSDIC